MAAAAVGPSSSSPKGSKTSNKPKPWARTDIPDLTGKFAVVTGGTGGIGYETAIALAKSGAEVFVVGRSEEKGNEAVEKIKNEIKLVPGTGMVSFLQADLGSLASIAEFAKNFNAKELALDILVNNAGISAPPTRQTTIDGFESVMGTNQLGTFALTGQLLPSLKRSTSPRVVTVSSAMAEHCQPLDFEDFQTERKKYPGHKLYAQSKLANMLFTVELQRRSDANGWGISAIVVHPGLVKTEMTAKRDTLFSKFIGVAVLPFFGQEAAAGSHPSLCAATCPTVKGGEYYGPGGLMGANGNVTKLEIPKNAKDVKAAEQLWTISEELTKVVYN